MHRPIVSFAPAAAKSPLREKVGGAPPRETRSHCRSNPRATFIWHHHRDRQANEPDREIAMKALAQAALARATLAAMRLVLHIALPVAIGVIFMTHVLTAPLANKDKPNPATSEQRRQA
jgi:hypothetical protein